MEPFLFRLSCHSATPPHVRFFFRNLRLTIIVSLSVRKTFRISIRWNDTKTPRLKSDRSTFRFVPYRQLVQRRGGASEITDTIWSKSRMTGVAVSPQCPACAVMSVSPRHEQGRTTRFHPAESLLFRTGGFYNLRKGRANSIGSGRPVEHCRANHEKLW